VQTVVGCSTVWGDCVDSVDVQPGVGGGGYMLSSGTNIDGVVPHDGIIKMRGSKTSASKFQLRLPESGVLQSDRRVSFSGSKDSGIQYYSGAPAENSLEMRGQDERGRLGSMHGRPRVLPVCLVCGMLAN